MSMRKLFVLFAVGVLSPLFAFAQGRVSARLDSTRIMVGSQCELTVEVNARQGARIQWPEVKDKKLSGSLEVVSQKNESEDNEGQSTLRRVYTITAWDEGKFSVPSLTIGVDGKKYHTSALPLEVTTVPLDTLHPDTPMPPYDIQQQPFDQKEWTSLYLWSILAILLMLLAWYLFSRLRSGKPIISRKQLVRQDPPHQKALRRINEIKSARLDGNDGQKEYYTLLTEALRKYMSERFGFNAMEMTSQEIVQRLKADQDQKKIDELRDLFATADLVKFAHYAADHHLSELYLTNVVQFIEDTKQTETPTETRVEMPLSDEDRTLRRRRRGVRIALWLSITAATAIVAYIAYTVCLLM